jgi:hypothetical protein
MIPGMAGLNRLRKLTRVIFSEERNPRCVTILRANLASPMP